MVLYAINRMFYASVCWKAEIIRFSLTVMRLFLAHYLGLISAKKFQLCRRWKRAHQKTEAAKHAGYRLQTMADHVRWGPASALGSTYVPSDSTLQLSPPTLTASASQLYAISNIQHTLRHPPRNQLYEEEANPYGRIMRTLQKHNSLNHSGGLHYDTLNSECASSDEIGFPSVPSNSFVYHGTFPDRTSIYR